MGGVARALETGWLQRQIAESAARQQWEVEQQRRVIVGVNDFVAADDDALGIPLLKVGDDAERDQRTRMAALRASRDNALCASRLDALRAASATSQNLVPFIRRRPRLLHAVRDSRGDGSRVRRLPRAGLLLGARCPDGPSGGNRISIAATCSSTNPILSPARDRPTWHG